MDSPVHGAETYRLLFERSPQPTWVIDRETLRFLAVNQAAVRQYGYSRDEFLQMTARDVRPPGEVARPGTALPLREDDAADDGSPGAVFTVDLPLNPPHAEENDD